MHIKHSFDPKLFAVCSSSCIDSIDLQARLYVVTHQQTHGGMLYTPCWEESSSLSSQNTSPFSKIVGSYHSYFYWSPEVLRILEEKQMGKDAHHYTLSFWH